jgi:hypothetical protein
LVLICQEILIDADFIEVFWYLSGSGVMGCTYGTLKLEIGKWECIPYGFPRWSMGTRQQAGMTFGVETF